MPVTLSYECVFLADWILIDRKKTNIIWKNCLFCVQIIKLSHHSYRVKSIECLYYLVLSRKASSFAHFPLSCSLFHFLWDIELLLCMSSYISFIINWIYFTGRVETLAICSSYYLWDDTSRTEASLGGLCGAYMGDDTLNVSFLLWFSCFI